MEPRCNEFPRAARAALADGTLQRALAKLQRDFRADRETVRERLPEFDRLRDAAVEIKDHALSHLDFYLETFEERVQAQGGRVHWCRTADEACAAVLGICRGANAATVVKGKSMISEEIALNDHLEQSGIRTVETDLGEYILQIRKDTPSHIVMPAIHLNTAQIGDSFRDGHKNLDPTRPLNDAGPLLEEARALLRREFLGADVGITGANMLVAETGAAVIVTNEGNGDLVQALPRVHIVLASLEKIVPTTEDVFTLLRLLPRSATGQEITSYVTFANGPRRADDLTGPDEFHVVLLDGGRSEILAGEFRDVLRCIRCGACQSLCPVYGAVGGHAYGWVYGGPVGAVLTPALIGIENACDLPEASSLCGKCEAVCPVRIPLPDLLRRWRRRSFDAGKGPAAHRLALRLWAFLALNPALYRRATRIAVGVLARIGAKKGRFRRLPFARSWTAARDLPAPAGGTFMDQWALRGRRGIRR